MKTIQHFQMCLVGVLLVSSPAGAQSVEQRCVDKSGDYSYDLLKGWTRRDVPQFKHDLLLLPQIDDNNRTVVINDQPGPGTLQDIAKKYERDLPKALKDFKLVSNELVMLKDKQQAVKIVHTNSNPGVRVRQINYIIEVGKHRYFVAYTGMEADGVVFDEMIQTVVASIGTPD